MAFGEDQSPGVKAIIDLVLGTPFPMFLILGPERRLIYNQAYIPVLGDRHPAAMGQPFFQVWPEVTAEIEPVIAKALKGEASHFENLQVVLHRPDPEQAWFTFSYSPVRDEASNIVGVLCICTETTESVRSRMKQSFLIELEGSLRTSGDPREIIATAQSALGRHFGVSRVGYGTLDPTGRYFTTEENWTDGSVPGHSGTHDLAAFGPPIFKALRDGISLFIDDTLLDERAQDSGAAAAFAALQVRSVATVSLVKGGHFLAALYLHHHEPRSWTAEERALIEEVAERTWSAVERAHAQASVRTSARRQAFLLALADRLRSLGRAEEITALAANLLGNHLQVGRAGYGEIDHDETKVTVESDWSQGTMASLAGETRPLEVFGPAIIAELQQGRTLRLDSVADNPLSAPYAAGYASIGTKSLLVVPLLKDGKFVAIFFLHEAEPRQWTEDDVALTSDVAERTWAAVERARAEAAVRELNHTLELRVRDALAERRLYADLVQLTDAPIQMIDRDYRFLAINPAAQEAYQHLFGVRPEIGQSLDALLAHLPEQRAEALTAWNRALAGEAFDGRAWWGGPGYEHRAYDMQFRPLWDENDEVSGAYLLGRDVTELLHEQERLAAAEDQLRQSQKMEALGQLTGGVAHDFNNLLTPIVGSLSVLQTKRLGGEREQRMVAGAAEAADRARVLVQRLLAFARRQPLQRTSVDTGELVRGMASLISSTVGPQITVAVDVQQDLPAANADINQLEMALLNLAVNARDAMPEGGTLRISTRLATEDVIPPPELRPGRYIRLSVSDTGTGMDEATLRRAVEPFFSTKGIGKGTGLGLSMVHGLASQLGGGLLIQSQLGVGTNVELWLQLGDLQSDVGQGSSGGERNDQFAGLALLVDDDDLVRSTTAEMLQELGYSVREASSAAEALNAIEGGLRPDVMVTDHLMPGMSGTDLARNVLELYPEIRVLIISGYSALDEIAPDLPRLSKPFRSEELAIALG